MLHFEHILQKRKIDENFILKLHAILMNGVRPDAGAYRNHPVRIVGVNLATANHMSIGARMSEIIALVGEKTKDVIANSADVHARFEHIHPFSDGNGRVGRLLLNAMLLRKNLAPAIIHQGEKRLYYTYLYKAQTENEQSRLEDFFCDSVLGGFDILGHK